MIGPACSAGKEAAESRVVQLAREEEIGPWHVLPLIANNKKTKYETFQSERPRNSLRKKKREATWR